MASHITLKANGLNTSPNSLEVQDGAMTVAKNVIIRRQDILEPRRGFKLYGDAYPLLTDRTKQLFEYQNLIIRHYANKLQYDNGLGMFSDFAGDYLEQQTGLRIKTISSNGNLYFTTSEGVQKISALSASDFTTSTGFITPAGGIKALDVNASLQLIQGNQTGFLPQDSAVAYRIVWSINDANSNLIQGVPSQRAEIYNEFNTLLSMDLNSLVAGIDNISSAGNSLITDTDYLSLAVSGSAVASILQTNVLALASKLDVDIYFANSGKLASYTGVINGTTAGVTIYANNAGVAGNSISLTFDGVQTIQNAIDTYNIANPLAQINLNTGDGTQIPGVFAVYSGTPAGATTGISLQALTAGTVGNSITLLFNGSNTINAAIASWNTNNPNNEVQLTSGDGTQIPTAGSISLTGGSGGVTINLSGGVDATTGTTPLAVSSLIDNNNNFYTLTFTGSSTISDYFYAGQQINLTDFTVPNGIISGPQTIISIDDSTASLTFQNPTVVIGDATLLGDVHNYEYTTIVSTAGTGQISDLTTLIIDTPTPDNEYLVIQDAIDRIISKLQTERNAVIPTQSILDYADNLDITTTANVNLTFTIPKLVTQDYFYQIYRSNTVSATGTTVLNNLTPDDEMQLVFEGFPTPEQLAAGTISVLDITSDGFKGAFLYTNAQTGEGIQNANEVPPFALDINRFKNCIFYANTKTKQIETISLLGVVNLINDFNVGVTPVITISDGTLTSNYKFVTGLQQKTDIQFITDVSSAYNGKRFNINTAANVEQYTFYYKTNTGGDIAPTTNGNITAISTGIGTSTITSAVHGLLTGDRVDISSTDSVPSIDGTYYVTVIDVNNFTIPITVTTAGQIGKWSRNAIIKEIQIIENSSANDIAAKSAVAIGTFGNDFLTTVTTDTVEITNVTSGATIGSTSGSMPSGVIFTTIQAGRGEDPSTGQVLLSQLVSPAQAVDETSRSLVRIINQDPNSPVYAFYLSANDGIPGQIEFEARNLNTDPFYILANNADVGQSFKPNISPLLSPKITNISTGIATITTSGPHGLVVGQKIILNSTNTTPSLDGIQTVSFVNSTTQFQINKILTVGSSSASYNLLTNLVPSSNQAKINRVYFSKLNQPEAVPILNFFDVGGSDKAILRIFPLRDSLFVFKEDGLYRISGENAPFSLALFDSSCFLIAPDSLGVTNNLIYCWTTQGVSTVAEAGVSFAISRPIDNLILPVQSSDFTSFKTSTFGIGYESDNSYTVYTVQDPTDVVATIGYRFNNLTNTWTIIDKTNTAGFIHYIDDKMYLGAGDINFIEQERKTSSRLDYADRELPFTISLNKLNGKLLTLPDVSQLSIGDVLVQTQTLTPYTFNRLLEKLDLDPNIGIFNLTTIPIANQTVTITSAVSTNLIIGDFVQLINTDCTPSIDGLYQVFGVPNSTSFTINITQPILVAGTSGQGRYLYSNSQSIISSGIDLRTKLVALASKLDGDPGTGSHNYSNLIASRVGVAITNSSTGNPTIITSTGHDLISGREITITGNTGSIPSINGIQIVTVIDTDHFSIPISTTTSGSGGSFNTDDSSFIDIATCYNAIIAHLNADTGVTINNFTSIQQSTSLETIITNINPILKNITLGLDLELVLGPVLVFKAIDCMTQYAPITMGDPLSFKHMSEATLMFTNRAFSTASISFSTDLLPQFIPVSFNSDGPGLFGFGNFGQGYFGGASNSAPLRTYVPRNAQRCRYLNVQFNHKIAREKFELLGITVTGNSTQSTRAYRE